MAVRPALRADSKELEGEKEEAAAAPLSSKGEERQRESSRVQESEKKEREVIVIKDDDDPTSSDSDATGVSDLRFGRRTQPLRCSRATRYHMLLEVALERKRQRQESKAPCSKDASKAKTCKSAGGGERDKVRGGKQQQKDYCALLFAKDPFDTSSDETDADWDPTAVFGEAARRRLKSRRSETESDSEEDTDASEEDRAGNADASKVEGEQQVGTQQAHPPCSAKRHLKAESSVSTPEREGLPEEQQTRSASSNREKKDRKPRGSKLDEAQRTQAKETKHDRRGGRSDSASASARGCHPPALPPLEITSGRTSTTTSESQEVLAEKKEEQQEIEGGETEKSRKTKSILGPHEGTSKAR
ncbi:hypothetical protein Emag_006122 [Eimeria magna]